MKTSAAKIIIPTPCHEDWNKMTNQSIGRHCDSCNKVVVDFTQSSQQEVIDYMHAHQNENVCGRVNPEVLEPSVFTNFQSDKLTKLKIFACALFMVFGSSLFGYGQSNKPVMGDVIAPQSVRATPPDTIHPVSGGIRYFPPDTIPSTQVNPEDLKNLKQGQIQYLPPDTIKPAEPIKMGKIKMEEPQKEKNPVKCTEESKTEKRDIPVLGMIVAPQHREKLKKVEEN
jgi:hypothetical protein